MMIYSYNLLIKIKEMANNQNVQQMPLDQNRL
jgi:hypothetical protein